MNKLISHFNINGDLLSITSPLYLKKICLENVPEDLKSSNSNLKDWYGEIILDPIQNYKSELLEWEKMKALNPFMITWVFSDCLDTTPPKILEIADFVVDQSSSEQILNLKNIELPNFPIGIGISLSDFFYEQHKIQEKNLMDLFDELLLKVNCWRQIGAKDIFIDIDLKDSFQLVNLYEILKYLRILKYLEVPITVRMPGINYFDNHAGLEILIDSLFELGCSIIRTDYSLKMKQLLVLWKNRMRLDNGY